MIPPRQLHVEALNGVGEVTYRNYSGSQSAAFNDRLGRLLLARLPVIPHGTLCFFSSYSLMERAAEAWQSSGLWEKISDVKRVVMEGRGADSFAETIDEYYSAVPTGALLLAVCRGKVSEGLDFKGEKARAVFVVGIPFPSYQDTKIKLKQQFNDRAQRQGGGVVGRVLPGSTWYRQQGYRAYNQAIGRCIRNLSDYVSAQHSPDCRASVETSRKLCGLQGAVLLVDARFHSHSEGHARHREQLSRWLRDKVQEHHPHDPRALEAFFTELQANPPAGAVVPSGEGGGATKDRGTMRLEQQAAQGPSALEIFAQNFAQPPAADADVAADAAPAVAPARPAEQPVEEVVATICEEGKLGLGFVQQGSKVVIRSVQPQGCAAQVPFPKIEVGMQLLRVSSGAAGAGGEEVQVQPPALAWARKLQGMARPLTLTLGRVRQPPGTQTTLSFVASQ